MLIAITTPWFTSIPEPFNEPILTDTKNGFTVDPNTPHPEPNIIVATDTSGSNPAIIIVVVTSAVKAIVSSDIPKLVPPSENKNIRTGININSFPFNFDTTEAIPASSAPVFVVIPKNPPINKTNMAISIELLRPFIGAIIKSDKLAGVAPGIKCETIAIIAVIISNTV